MQDGFLFDELTKFANDIFKEVENKTPLKLQKFIKKEGRKLSKVAKKIAKSEVGTAKGKKNWIAEKSYHKKFDSSSVYEKQTGEICCKAYNSAPHANLIENGHNQVPRGVKGISNKGGQPNGFTPGKNIFKKAEIEFKQEFENDCETFLEDYVEGIISK